MSLTEKLKEAQEKLDYQFRQIETHVKLAERIIDSLTEPASEWIPAVGDEINAGESLSYFITKVSNCWINADSADRMCSVGSDFVNITLITRGKDRMLQRWDVVKRYGMTNELQIMELANAGNNFHYKLSDGRVASRTFITFLRPGPAPEEFDIGDEVIKHGNIKFISCVGERNCEVYSPDGIKSSEPKSTFRLICKSAKHKLVKWDWVNLEEIGERQIVGIPTDRNKNDIYCVLGFQNTLFKRSDFTFLRPGKPPEQEETGWRYCNECNRAFDITNIETHHCGILSMPIIRAPKYGVGRWVENMLDKFEIIERHWSNKAKEWCYRDPNGDGMVESYLKSCDPPENKPEISDGI